MAEIPDNAIAKLKENTGFDIHVSDTKLRKNGLITIEGERFLVEVKPEITRGFSRRKSTCSTFHSLHSF